jgi:hypothetical protein
MTKRVLCIVTGTEGYGVRRVWSCLISGLHNNGWNVTGAVLESKHVNAWEAEFLLSKVVNPKQHVQLETSSSGSTGRYFSMLRRGLFQVRQRRYRSFPRAPGRRTSGNLCAPVRPEILLVRSERGQYYQFFLT